MKLFRGLLGESSEYENIRKLCKIGKFECLKTFEGRLLWQNHKYESFSHLSELFENYHHLSDLLK